MAQEKILGNQLNIPDVASEINSSLVTVLSTDTAPVLGGDLALDGFSITESVGSPAGNTIALDRNIIINSEGDIQLNNTNDRILLTSAAGGVQLTAGLGIPDAPKGVNVELISSENVIINALLGAEILLGAAGSPAEAQSSILLIDNTHPTDNTRVRLGPGSGSSYTCEISSPSAPTESTQFELPGDNGTNGYVLSTDGAGVTYWGAAGGGSSYNWITGNAGRDFGVAPQTIITGSPLPSQSTFAIGNAAQASGYSSFAIGSYAKATPPGNNDSVAVGNFAYALHGSAVCLGSGVYSGANYQSTVGIGITQDATTYRSTFGYGDYSALGDTSGNQSLVSLYGKGKCELHGAEAMFVAPPYTLATLPTVVEGGIIYVTDADAFGATVGALAFGRAAFGSPETAAAWIDVTTGSVLEVGGG